VVSAANDGRLEMASTSGVYVVGDVCTGNNGLTTMTPEERVLIMRTIGQMLKDDDTQAANAANEELARGTVIIPALRTLCFSCGLDDAFVIDPYVLESLACHWSTVV
jgi:hypothetical protein